MLISFVSIAEAGEIKSVYQNATAEKYWDWSYAQRVWFDFNTTDKFVAEWNKYSGDFEPWLSRYQKDARKALDELDSMPKSKRLNVQRGYDMQLAFDQWWDHVYSPWYNRYDYVSGNARREGKAAPTFDDYLVVWGKRQTCRPERLLDECGPIPDWRSPEWRTKEQAMMQKVNADLDARAAAKKTK